MASPRSNKLPSESTRSGTDASRVNPNRTNANHTTEPFGPLLFLFDRDHGPTNRLVTRWLFLRLLGGVYFAAFFALAFQILGLVGSEGIQPVESFLAALQPLGSRAFWAAPSLLWWVHPAPASLDHALTALVWTGMAASVLVMLNLVPKPALLVCFVCYLSFVTTAQDFAQYQSDGMLLEAGFLALFVAPSGLRPGWGRRSLASRTALFLLLWEWFRIYFESGVVKLASGDPAWRHLTAMDEYYQNGPLPTWVGWYLQQLPHRFGQGTAAATLVMELVLVWLALLPRRGRYHRWRSLCFALVSFWQIGVIATANYAFLNYLVLFLGVLLLDDQALIRFVPKRWQGNLNRDLLSARPEAQPALESAGTESAVIERPVAGPAQRVGVRRHPREVVPAARVALTTVLLTATAYATVEPLLALFWPAVPLPTAPVAALAPFRIADTYGLFAVMTPHRYEIEFQGSDDGQHWIAYPFRYKPQDPRDRPRIYAPYQPRFDWNLWFASLTTWEQAPIVAGTEIRLLQGSPPVLGLFAVNPFRDHPPRFVRSVLWQYWFSTPEEKHAEGVWWRRQPLGTYAPTLTRQPDGRFAAVALPTLNGPP